VPAEARGRSVRCPHCKQRFQAPAAEAEASNEAPKQVSIYGWSADSLQAAASAASSAEAAAPERRKKKKKRPEVDIAEGEQAKAGVPAWVWWWASLFVVGALVAAGFAGMYLSGYPKLTLFWLIQLAITLPIATVVFAASMFLSNWFGAGIELANFSTLIPKALLLVLLATLPGLIFCVGWLVSLGVWFIGAMIIFKLEAWETRFLVAVNWVLGTGMWLLLLRILMAAAAKE
jgi:hypothetical protein